MLVHAGKRALSERDEKRLISWKREEILGKGSHGTKGPRWKCLEWGGLGM